MTACATSSAALSFARHCVYGEALLTQKQYNVTDGQRAVPVAYRAGKAHAGSVRQVRNRKGGEGTRQARSQRARPQWPRLATAAANVHAGGRQPLKSSKAKVFVTEILHVGDALDVAALWAKVVLLHTVEEDHANEEEKEDAGKAHHEQAAVGKGGRGRRV